MRVIKLSLAVKLLTLMLLTSSAQRQEPKDGNYCSPTAHITPDNVCNCTAMGGYMNCADDGSLTTETMMCNSYCNKNNCTCCKYVHGQKPDKPKGKT